MKSPDEVIRRALSSGIRFILDVGINQKSWKKSLELSGKYDIVFSSLGLHPHFADNPGALSKIESLINKKVLAIGETGMDLYRNLSDPKNQARVFEEHIKLAIKNALPLVLHVREAHKEVLKILEGYRGEIRGVVHCFSGGVEEAHRYMDLGFYISISGTITRPGSKLQDVVKEIPLSMLLVETDCPYLTPFPLKGRNEPSYVIYTLRKISEILGVEEEELSRRVYENGRKLFSPGDTQAYKEGAL